MKSLTLKFRIFAIVFVCVLGLSSLGFAAWTGHALSLDAGKQAAWSHRDTWQMVYRLKFTVTSDGTDPAEFNLSTYDTASVLDQVKGGALYRIHTCPGAQAPDAAVTIGFDGDLGEDWTSTVTTSLATQCESFSGGSEIFWDLQIDFPDIGSAGDIIILYFTIVK